MQVLIQSISASHARPRFVYLVNVTVKYLLATINHAFSSVHFLIHGLYFICRLFIWRSILQLPENHTSFSAFVAMGTHSAFVNIEKKYPIKSQKLLRVLKR